VTVRVVGVPLGERSYEVHVGQGVLASLQALIPGEVRRIAIVTQEAVPVDVTGMLGPRAVARFVIGPDERAKTLSTVEDLCRGFVEFGLTRRDLVVAVGGGMVTDVAGFAAACFHRGVRVLHVPTTLLGMVDAAIGGKTGVNLAEGKNLVGAFWQPLAVLCDVDVLDTLPERERRCGFGEMAKYHFMTGEDLLALPLVDRIAECVRIKAEVVASDEREGGRRAVLNYGHTLAHALEIATDHRLAHGEAVAIGLVFAAELAAELGRIGPDRVREHERVVVDEYGLTVSLPDGVDTGSLVALMGRDKKAVDGLTFVLDGPDGLDVVSGIDQTAVARALERFRSR
jgi:5-deoxy-5-amino-3-dehydroquinate synthase